MVCSYITKIPEKVNTAMYFSGRPCAVQLYIVHNFDIYRFNSCITFLHLPTCHSSHCSCCNITVFAVVDTMQ